jgi:hypothetical protein
LVLVQCTVKHRTSPGHSKDESNSPGTQLIANQYNTAT